MKPSFKPVADHALLVTLATEVSEEANLAIIALDQAINAAEITGLSETIPAFVNLLIEFDPLMTDHGLMEQAVRGLFPTHDHKAANPELHIVEVCYEGDYAQDLQAVADICGISTESVVNSHLAGNYKVGMYGFAPGYAYMSGVAEQIQVPRKSAAVRDIPAGSVIIAGPQCLITTMLMPTGWCIIGRTHTEVLRDDPIKPFLFNVGDRVAFKRVSLDDFHKGADR